MPRKVNHDQRRRAIAEALCRVAADNGLEAVSLSEVAAAAGISKGLVQHYFSTKSSMLGFTASYLKEQVEQRIASRLAAAEPTDSPAAALRTLLFALLPTADARSEALAATAFTFHAMKDAELAAQFRLGHHQLTAAVADHLVRAQAAGEVRSDLDASFEAEILLAVVNGIGDALVLGYDTPDAATAVLDYHLKRLAVGAT